MSADTNQIQVYFWASFFFFDVELDQQLSQIYFEIQIS